MARQPSRNPAFAVVLTVVGVLAAVAIAVAFDSPTSVFLLVGLVIVFGMLAIYSGRRGGR